MEPATARTLDQIAAELAATAGPALPGTLVVRSYACGKPRCRCHADPPVLHGPYAEWTRKIGGKTVTRRLTPEQLAPGGPYSTTPARYATCSPSSRSSPSRPSAQTPTPEPDKPRKTSWTRRA